MAEQIIKILDDIAKKAGQTIDWAGNNIIPQLKIIMNHYVMYKTVDSIVMIILFGLLIYMLFYIYKNKLDKIEDYDYECLAKFIVIAIIAFLILIEMVYIGYLAKCIFFPEGVIIEYIRNTLK